jgi:hypothetical protein
LVQHIQHQDVDFKKWDACILADSTADVYLLSSWLNVVCPNWSALVAEDYAAVFPIFGNKKLVWSFFDLPNFVQKIAGYGDERFEKEIAVALNTLNATFDYLCYTTDERLITDASLQIKPRRHQLLELQEGVRFPTKVWGRNIRKAEASGLTTITSVPITIFIAALKKELIEKGKPYKNKDYHLLEVLAQKSIQEGYGFIDGIRDETGTFTCGQFYIYAKGKMYLVACFSNEVARQHSLLHYALFKIIEKAYISDSMLRVHFGGSNLPVIADFNKNFGAQDEEFVLVLKYNLPFWFRFFKRI